MRHEITALKEDYSIISQKESHKIPLKLRPLTKILSSPKIHKNENQSLCTCTYVKIVYHQYNLILRRE